MSFAPVYSIGPGLAKALMRIEAARVAVERLPITPSLLSSLRETARLHTTHYSTMIEGNRLTEEEVEQVVMLKGHVPGRDRDEKEVLGYYAALDYVENMAAKRSRVTEGTIRRMHALVMNGGRLRSKPTPYRDGQNVIRDSASRRIVYMPPEANDVPALMNELVDWFSGEGSALPCPLQASIVHYQFATIHPYYDGNGRTARLLTSLALHLGGYGLKGLYSLEAYYARNLPAYYAALSLGPSHNYYLGRAEADITPWLEYFCDGVAQSFEAVQRGAEREATGGVQDGTAMLRKLDARQREVLTLFRDSETITAGSTAELLGVRPRTGREVCRKWVESGFLVIADPAKRSRKYTLGDEWMPLIS